MVAIQIFIHLLQKVQKDRWESIFVVSLEDEESRNEHHSSHLRLKRRTRKVHRLVYLFMHQRHVKLKIIIPI